MIQDQDLEARAREYVAAFGARELSRCLEFFADDARLAWQGGIYQGKSQIEEWHKDRFAADLRVIQLEDVRVEGNTVTIDGVVTSNRLKAWRLGSLGGRITVVFHPVGSIQGISFTVRVTNPLEQWS